MPAPATEAAPAPSTVNVIGPNGNVGSLPAALVPKALKQGYRLETPAEAAKANQEAEFGDRPIAAGAAGLARGATLGLSDLIATQTGAVRPRTLKGLDEANPASSMIGEGVGTLGSLLIPGEGEANAVKLVSKAGKAAEGLVSGAGLGAKVLRGAAGAAVEGGLFGASHALDRAVIDDEPATAEKILGGAAMGALLVGGGGAILGGAKGLLGKGAEALQAKAEAHLAAAEAKATAASAEKEAARIASAKGEVGAEAQKASRELENMLRLRDTPGMSEATKSSIDAMLNSPDAIARHEKLAANVLESAPAALERLSEKQNALGDLMVNRDANIASGAEALLSPKAAFEQVKARAARYISPAIGKVAGGVAGVLGGGPFGGLAGSIAGEQLGSLAGGQLRPSTLALKRMMEHPAVVKAFWGSIKAATEATPELFGAYAPVLETAAAKGADELMATHIALAQNDSHYTNQMALAGYPQESPAETASALNKSNGLNHMQETVNAFDAKTDAAVGRFFGQQSGAHPGSDSIGTREERLQKYQTQLKALTELNGSPDLMMRALQPGNTLATSAPGVANAATAAAAQALQFLNAKAPRNPSPEPIPALARPWAPSDAELGRFERYVSAVNDPQSVLADLKRGTASPESIETLQAVYPKLLEDIRQRMMERLSGYEGTVTPQQRQALGTLFGGPIGLSPSSNIAIFQQSHAVAQAQEAARQQRARASNAVKKDGSTTLATQSQALEGR